jgi:hypothetical protein
MARDDAALGALAADPAWYELETAPREWSDDFSSLASVIQWSAHRPAR